MAIINVNIPIEDAVTDGSLNPVTSNAVFDALALKANEADLALVATSGDYNDLNNLPTIPSAQVNSDWNATSGVAEILNKPTISAGTVTSVGLTMPSAFTVANSPITSSGDIAVTGAGLVSQYVRGDGTLANFPASTGGGASLSFYLNGSISQGTFGGVAFKEMDRTPILGAGTDFTINANGYIQSFITDANVPNLLEIPGGNWNFETYFSASSNGGSPSFYLELYKWNGATLSLIASSSTNPEFITGGTRIDLYVSALAVPQTTLLATDRLAVRIYVNNSGRTITLHTENSHLSQVITTFSTGITALNGLTDQVQNLSVGTSGTDFAINSATGTHTFNLPTASATNRGALSSADWTTFNGKQPTLVSGTTIKTINGTTLLGSGDLVVGSSSGVFGIANSSGVYTYYATLTLAMAGATSGQTIEMFADVTETTNVTVNLKNGVNINGNGHTYTLNVAGTANCIQDNAVAVNCSIFNIMIKRLGGTASSVNTLCMYVTGASVIKCYSTILIGGATNMRCLTINNASAQIFGVYAEGYNPCITVTNGQLYNSTGRSFGGTGITVEANGTAIKCVSYGYGADGLISAGKIIDCVGYGALNNGIYMSGGLIQNCTGYGGGGAGISINGALVVAINSTGYSVGGYGIFTNSNINIGLKGYSTASVGIYLTNGILTDCLGYSTANVGIRMENSGATISELRSCKAISTTATAISQVNLTSGSKIINTEAICKWNNVAGHGIVLLGNNTQIVQCVVEVTNATANCLNAASALTAKYANNAFAVATTPININITQGMVNVHDLQGNILI